MSEPPAAAKNYNILRTWTIYQFPLDYPSGYVVTEWHVRGGYDVPRAASTFRCDTLTQARTHIADYGGELYRMPRNPGDEPQILETWI